VQVRVALGTRAAELAGRQFGVVARRQLVALGMTRGTIDRWIKQGRLHRVHQGVFLLGHDVPAPLAREQAALLAAGDGSVLSHRTSARLDGYIEEDDDAPIHVTTRRHRGRPRGVVVHTSTRIGPGDTAYRHDLRVTTPARTLLDLAEIADSVELERALETAFARRRVNERQLRAVIERTPGRRGGRRLTALLDYRGGAGFTRSWAEDRLRRLARAADLPGFVCNDRVAGYEVDFHFVGHGVIVEVDSWRYHSGQADFTRDRRKWAHLRARGYEVVGVTAQELEHQPEAAIARIATAVALASQR
jgi:very-short-patch-repair endonuclease